MPYFRPFTQKVNQFSTRPLVLNLAQPRCYAKFNGFFCLGFVGVTGILQIDENLNPVKPTIPTTSPVRQLCANDDYLFYAQDNGQVFRLNKSGVATLIVTLGGVIDSMACNKSGQIIVWSTTAGFVFSNDNGFSGFNGPFAPPGAPTAGMYNNLQYFETQKVWVQTNWSFGTRVSDNIADVVNATGPLRTNVNQCTEFDGYTIGWVNGANNGFFYSTNKLTTINVKRPIAYDNFYAINTFFEFNKNLYACGNNGLMGVLDRPENEWIAVGTGVTFSIFAGYGGKEKASAFFLTATSSYALISG